MPVNKDEIILRIFSIVNNLMDKLFFEKIKDTPPTLVDMQNLYMEWNRFDMKMVGSD